MKTVTEWFDEYSESHQNKTNKLIHWFCVPTILFSLIVVMAWLIYILPVGVGFYIALFVFAWIGQFYGHKIEGKKPSFFKDFQFLLIGPIWCMDSYLSKLVPKLKTHTRAQMNAI